MENWVPRLEVVEDVSGLCFLGELGGKGDFAQVEGLILELFTTCTEGPVDVNWKSVQY